MSLVRAFGKGVLADNPLVWAGLGLCPALAVSTTVQKGLGLGVATLLVLAAACGVVSLVGKRLPPRAGLPVAVGVVAGLTAAVEAAMTSAMPSLSADLGIFVSLIAVNCLVLGRVRVQMTAERQPAAFAGSLGAGLGFVLVMVVTSAVREAVGSGALWGLALFGPDRSPVAAVALAPGAFITLGLVTAAFRLLRRGN